jgi:GNAT superfamily N-acetyltransferase
MDKKKAFILRPVEPDDIDGAMKLSNAEGWNQTAGDWKHLIENPGNICMAAECEGKVIGTTIAVNYSNQVAWISMVLVDKEYRGQGVSKSLLLNVLKQSEFFKSIKLDATPEGQQVYKKFDFKDEYRIARMTNLSMKNLSSDNDNDISEPIQQKHIQEIIALDEIIFGANRTQLIKSLLREDSGKAWLVKRNNQITGFALGRDGNKYHHIGPVVASNSTDAKILITKALNKLTNQLIVVDVLCDKEDLLDWLSSIGFIKQRHFIRMYKKENELPGIIDNQYLICGPEFG